MYDSIFELELEVNPESEMDSKLGESSGASITVWVVLGVVAALFGLGYYLANRKAGKSASHIEQSCYSQDFDIDEDDYEDEDD